MPSLSDAMNKQYSTTPLIFQTATSELFDCDFATRDDGIVFHFRPHNARSITALHKAVKTAFGEVLGHIADRTLKTEVVSDEELGIAPNVFVRVADFGNDSTAARSVIERGIGGAYAALRSALG